HGDLAAQPHAGPRGRARQRLLLGMAPGHVVDAAVSLVVERRDPTGGERHRRRIDRVNPMGAPARLRRPLARDLWRRPHDQIGAGGSLKYLNATAEPTILSACISISVVDNCAIDMQLSSVWR